MNFFDKERMVKRVFYIMLRVRHKGKPEAGEKVYVMGSNCDTDEEGFRYINHYDYVFDTREMAEEFVKCDYGRDCLKGKKPQAYITVKKLVSDFDDI